MGRSTAGVIGMRFKTEEDHLLSMDVVREGAFVVTATDGGYAKRTSVEEWNSKGRGTQGVRAMRLNEDRGGLVGAMIALETDQIFAIASNGVVIRTTVSDVRATGRDTQGVKLMNLSSEDTLVGIARSPERDDDEDGDDIAGEEAVEGATESPVATDAPAEVVAETPESTEGDQE
jgi:DNA gyrase subunit A